MQNIIIDPPHENLPPGYATRWWALLFINISLFVVALDNAVLNVAIPSLSLDLGATAANIQWIIDAYGLIFAALLLTTGALSDRYGRKRWLQAGVALFGIGSLAASFTNSVETLIAARAFLGVSAAIILPSTLSLVVATFPENERAKAIGIWTTTFGAGFALGPVIGGYLVETYSWTAVFLLNVPVSIIAITGGYFFIAESRDEHAPKVDRPGVILSVAGLFVLVYAIIKAGEVGWGDTQVLVVFALSAVLLAAFAIWEMISDHPMLPMGFFKNPSFSAASMAISLSIFAMFGTILFVSQYLQTVQGFSPLEGGLRTLPMAIGFMIFSGISALVASRLGIKITVALGILVAAGGLYYSSQIYEIDTPYLSIAASLVIISAGLGLVMAPATDSIMGSVPEHKAGIGSAMNDTTREIGGALGVAILGTLLNNVYIEKVGTLASRLPGLPAEALEAIKDSVQGAHFVAADPNMPSEVSLTILDVANNAFVNGMTDAMFIGSLIMLGAGALVVAFLPATVRRPQEDLQLLPDAPHKPQQVLEGTNIYSPASD